MEGLKSATLYQNEEKTVTLIDIPTSISLGQLLPDQALEQVLLSSAPLESPYTSTEPKSDAARAIVVSRMGASEDSYAYSQLIRKGLRDVREHHQGDWCLPRQLSPLIPTRRNKKRKIDNVDSSQQSSRALEEPDLSTLDIDTQLAGDCLQAEPPSEQDITTSIQNHTSNPTVLSTTPHQATYHIPGRAAVIVGTVSYDTAAAFGDEVSQLYTQPSCSARRTQLDFILLDPPWHNRSVTRSKRYKTKLKEDPATALSGILGTHIAPRGYVACWITNKNIVRSTAIACFFNAWDVELIEEWIWVKTTTKGEPVYDIDGLWRKPYEILLLGRKHDPHPQSDTQTEETPTKSVQRRLIFGVPDLHSRKPCLRELIEPLMPDPSNYRALEVFARNMTAGWLAWGDEALKFNWSGHWSKMEGPIARGGDEQETLPEAKSGDA
ncbi:hypothetical protein MMC30_007058 [Trapelia coarctata]|nr:hypothetical protein [Trapelia coarctata]